MTSVVIAWRFAIVLILFSVSFLAPARASAVPSPLAAGHGVRIVSVDDRSLVLEMVVDTYRREPVQGTTGAALIHIPGTVQTAIAGAPQLPFGSVLLGVPATAGLALEVLESHFETREGIRLPPAPGTRVEADSLYALAPADLVEVPEPDSAIYAADAFYPEAPAILGEAGMLRDQAVVAVAFYPVQYNPVGGSVRIYNRIRVRLSWQPSLSPGNASPTHPLFEELLARTLLNYSHLQRPAPAPSDAPAAPVQTRALRATGEQWKIGVEEDGLYRLSHADLVAAGIDPGAIDPRTLRLTVQGSEIPILVPGEEDGVFNGEDAILFYATALHDSRYTQRNIYWLSWGGAAGQRMAARDGTPQATTPLAADFPALLHAEQDSAYWGTMPDGEGQDKWFWGTRLAAQSAELPAARDHAVALDHINPSVPSELKASVRVRLRGRTSLAHRTKVHLNGTEIDDQAWQGQIVFDHEVSLDHSLLQEGDNVVRVEVVDTGAAVDEVFVNWIEIEYRDTHVAEGGELVFAPPAGGNHRYAVTNFAADTISLLDISDPDRPVVIEGGGVAAAGETFTLTFEQDTGATSRFLALDDSALRTPVSIEADAPSSWKAPGNAADYLLITHEDFYDSIQPLADHRRAQGLDVATVKVGDLYDEFSHGIFTPQALRDFLAYVHGNWAKVPLYVLLVGDAYYDFKDNTDTGTRTYVPSQLIDTQTSGEVASDNWFATVSGDDVLPDFMLGRLSVSSVAEADAVVAKIIGYDAHPGTDVWNSRVLLVADDQEITFETSSDRLATQLPFYYGVEKVYAGDYPPKTDPTVDIKAQIQEGVVLVNYLGHGAVSNWGDWGDTSPGKEIFDARDMKSLRNGDKLPVFTIANCLNGLFNGPQSFPAGAEHLQRQAGGGAVGVWAPTGLGYPAGHRVLLQEFYDAIFRDDQPSMGHAIAAATLAAYASSPAWGELIETFVFFGDPAMALAIPDNYPYLEHAQPAAGTTEIPIDQEVVLWFNKQMAEVDVVLRDGEGAPVPLTPLYQEGENTRFGFGHGGLAHGQTYALLIAGRDRADRLLDEGPVPVDFSFTVTTDDVPPQGALTLAEGPVGAPITATVAISFSEPVRSESLEYVVEPAAGGRLRWSGDALRADLLLADLEEDQSYTVIVTAVRDRAGNPLTGPIDLVFQTGSIGTDLYLPAIVRK